MRHTTTITTKGQLTIPKAVRDWLGIGKGTCLEITVGTEEFQARLVPARERAMNRRRPPTDQRRA